jgi:hypothetical protein
VRGIPGPRCGLSQIVIISLNQHGNKGGQHMPETYPKDSREAILLFHFADRMKSELLIASQLLTTILQLKGQEQEGGKRLFIAYFRALEREMSLGIALVNDQDMIRMRTVLTGLTGMADSNLFTDIQDHLTWIISTVTTYAQRSMEYLMKEGLL